MRTLKEKPIEQYQNVPNIRTHKELPTPEQIHQCAQDIYATLGSADRMTLNDWRQAEQELKQQLEDPLRERLLKRGMLLISPHRRGRKKPAFNDGRWLRRYRKRWKVERTFA